MLSLSKIGRVSEHECFLGVLRTIVNQVIDSNMGFILSFSVLLVKHKVDQQFDVEDNLWCSTFINNIDQFKLNTAYCDAKLSLLCRRETSEVNAFCPTT